MAPNPQDRHPVPEAHGRVAHRPHGEIGRIPVHQRLGRYARRRLLYATGLDAVGVPHGQVTEHEVAFLNVVCRRFDFDYLTQTHIAQ